LKVQSETLQVCERCDPVSEIVETIIENLFTTSENSINLCYGRTVIRLKAQSETVQIYERYDAANEIVESLIRYLRMPSDNYDKVHAWHAIGYVPAKFQNETIQICERCNPLTDLINFFIGNLATT
jgi:hypothetical protein